MDAFISFVCVKATTHWMRKHFGCIKIFNILLSTNIKFQFISQWIDWTTTEAHKRQRTQTHQHNTHTKHRQNADKGKNRILKSLTSSHFQYTCKYFSYMYVRVSTSAHLKLTNWISKRFLWKSLQNPTIMQTTHIYIDVKILKAHFAHTYNKCNKHTHKQGRRARCKEEASKTGFFLEYIFT